MANKTFKAFVDKMGGTTATNYIGNEGELFYDPTTTTLRIGDGETPGGTVISSGGSADLGDLKISGSTLGTQGNGSGWGATWLYLDPGGESYAGISIPSPADQQTGSYLQVYGNAANGGGIQFLTANGTWNYNNSGTLSFPNNTLRSESDTLMIENFQRRSQLRLDENNDLTRLSQWSGQRSQSFTSADWDTASYVADEGGGYVTFTGAVNILDWLDSVPFADRISLLINDGLEYISTTGYNAGDGAITFYVTVAPNTSPTTVTSVVIRYYYESKLEFDYDDEEILLRGVDSDIIIRTVQSGRIEIESTDGIQIQTSSGDRTWEFSVEGDLTLPREGKLYGIGLGSAGDRSGYISWAGNTSGDGLGYNTMRLVPDQQGLEDLDQYIILDPTSPGHIHIRAGGTQDSSDAHLYLGGENSYVTVAAGINPSVSIAANSNLWTFGTDGKLTLPGDIQTAGDLLLTIPSGVPTAISNIDSSGFWESNPTSNLATTGGSGTGLRVNIGDFESGYAGTITIHTAGTGYTHGDIISVVSGTASATFAITVPASSFTFGGDGSIEFPDTSVQTGAAISIADLKTLVAAANTYAEFQTAIAAL
jgi:hypothetical protein